MNTGQETGERRENARTHYGSVRTVKIVRRLIGLNKGRSGRAVSSLAFHQGEPGSIPGRVTGFSHVGIVPAMPLVGGFLGDLPFPSPLHSGAAPYSPQSPTSALNTSLLRAPKPITVYLSLDRDGRGKRRNPSINHSTVGKDKPIAFASRTLNKAETNYSTTEREMLALVLAVKHFRPYLFGRQFKIVTDHKPLQYVFNVKDYSSRPLKWRLKLAKYSFEITYKAGKTITHVDALSRTCYVKVEAKAEHSKSWENQGGNKASRPHVRIRLEITDTPQIVGEKCSMDIMCLLTVIEQGKQDTWINNPTFVHNTTRHETTGFTPHELMFGRLPNLPGILQKEPTEIQYCYDDYLKDLKTRLQETYKIARKHLIAFKESNKRNYDKRTREHIFEVEDKVPLFDETLRTVRVLEQIRDNWISEFPELRIHPDFTMISKGKNNYLTLNGDFWVQFPAKLGSIPGKGIYAIFELRKVLNFWVRFLGDAFMLFSENFENFGFPYSIPGLSIYVSFWEFSGHCTITSENLRELVHRCDLAECRSATDARFGFGNFLEIVQSQVTFWENCKKNYESCYSDVTSPTAGSQLTLATAAGRLMMNSRRTETSKRDVYLGARAAEGVDEVVAARSSVLGDLGAVVEVEVNALSYWSISSWQQEPSSLRWLLPMSSQKSLQFDVWGCELRARVTRSLYHPGAYLDSRLVYVPSLRLMEICMVPTQMVDHLATFQILETLPAVGISSTLIHIYRTTVTTWVDLVDGGKWTVTILKTSGTGAFSECLATLSLWVKNSIAVIAVEHIVCCAEQEMPTFILACMATFTEGSLTFDDVDGVTDVKSSPIYSVYIVRNDLPSTTMLANEMAPAFIRCLLVYCSHFMQDCVAHLGLPQQLAAGSHLLYTRSSYMLNLVFIRTIPAVSYQASLIRIYRTAVNTWVVLLDDGKLSVTIFMAFGMWPLVNVLPQYLPSLPDEGQTLSLHLLLGLYRTSLQMVSLQPMIPSVGECRCNGLLPAMLDDKVLLYDYHYMMMVRVSGCHNVTCLLPMIGRLQVFVMLVMYTMCRKAEWSLCLLPARSRRPLRDALATYRSDVFCLVISSIRDGCGNMNVYTIEYDCPPLCALRSQYTANYECVVRLVMFERATTKDLGPGPQRWGLRCT
ncbi:hypothetical protein PR048_012751 [Dryococelus australis]|uniref:Reverse transcriptase RNase H-like domain-containing protein n=1 Tax=Dryococelus australis TaxID=614101 RepID=A0ABQ9HQW2_9NEOP|nr:hypothetical protein PR048_012751 [Dryococelus australis]